MKTKVLTLAIALNVFAAAPMWAQQKSPDANLLAQLEKRLAESDTKSKGLTGGAEVAMAPPRGQDRENY